MVSMLSSNRAIISLFVPMGISWWTEWLTLMRPNPVHPQKGQRLVSYSFPSRLPGLTRRSTGPSREYFPLSLLAGASSSLFKVRPAAGPVNFFR
jgi:hypothetical protein